jgi:thiamine-monophosphate kinase
LVSADLTERGVIATARKRSGAGAGVRVGIGDDCAVLEPDPGETLLATTDLLIEDVHFRRRYATPADIGWKSLAVNLSDIASMGGRPRWALIALACPATTPAGDIEAFYEAVNALAEPHGVTIVGGDTSSSPHGWTINVTMLGQARRPYVRSTARAGDIIAVTGPLGRSAAGLAVLERGSPTGVPAELVTEATVAHLRTDLAHIAEASGVGARVDRSDLPSSAAVASIAAAVGADATTWATRGGEDYELLLTCEPDAVAMLQNGLARATGATLTVIGEMVNGSGIRFVDAAGRDAALGPGWQHFATGQRE